MSENQTRNAQNSTTSQKIERTFFQIKFSKIILKLKIENLSFVLVVTSLK